MIRNPLIRRRKSSRFQPGVSSRSCSEQREQRPAATAERRPAFQNTRYAFYRRFVAFLNNRFSSQGVARSTRVRPELCQLEDRLVPTLSFTPVFGPFTPDTTVSHNGAVLVNPSVVLIFEPGSYWNAPTGITVQDVDNAALNIANSSFTDPVGQYGSTGRTTISFSITEDVIPFTTNAAGVQGFRENDLSNAADGWMTYTDVTSAASDRSIYFVVTPPGVVDFDSGAWGYHRSRMHTENITGGSISAPVPFGWLGINVDGTQGATTQSEIDDVSRTFSHELVEARTDPYIFVDNGDPIGDANRFYPGANWFTHGFDEIADFEPDGRDYTYRLPNGTVVEPYWSQNTQSFVVADGNNQVFTLNPVWPLNGAGLPMPRNDKGEVDFLHQYDLVVNGDQTFNQDDAITIETIPSGIQAGGVLVTENGETVSFGAGQIRNLTVNAGAGNDTVTVESLPATVALTINLGGQSDDNVQITPTSGYASDVQGSVSIIGTAGNGHLTIDDHNAPANHQITDTINGNAIIRHDALLAIALPVDYTISFQGIGGLNIYTGNSTKSVAVQASQFHSPMIIDVFGTGSTSVIMNDTNTLDSGVVYSLESNDITRSSAFFGNPVTVGYENVASVTINASSSFAATYDIVSTVGKPVTINAGSQGNTFNVGDGATPLDANLATLNIVGSGTNNNLVLDDRGTEVSGLPETLSFDLSATATGGSVVRTHSITYTDAFGPFTLTSQETFNYSGIQNVAIFGGSVGSQFQINSTPSGTSTHLTTGDGADTMDLVASAGPLFIDNVSGIDSLTAGSAAPALGGNLQGITGPLTVSSSGGQVNLFLDDSSDTTGRTVTISPTVIAGLAPGQIQLTAGAVIPNTILGGQGSDTFHITSPAVKTFVRGGAGSDTLVGPDATSTWTIGGPASGTVDSASFTEMETLRGGSMEDLFRFQSGGTVPGVLDGGGGINTLDYSPDGGVAATVNLQLHAASRIKRGTAGGYGDIHHFVGSGAAGDNLVGLNTLNNWSITAANAGNVNGLAFSGFENLFGGSMTDNFKFGPAGSVTGTINGQSGTDRLDYSGNGGAAISVSLQTSAAARIHSGQPGGFTSIESIIGSSSTADTLVGANTTNLWQITGTSAGQVNTVAFQNIERLIGGSSVDTFKMSPAGRITAIQGGGGSDWLDYSLFPAANPVQVNLTTGSATNVGGGRAGAAAGIKNAIGGSGNDSLIGSTAGSILIGGAGADTLTAGGGRSILIGGAGADTMTGGGADDLLIGGTTSFDMDKAALAAILNEWQRTDETYAQRIADLRAGTGFALGHKLVLGTTVLDDAFVDVLKGNGGLDWFFANLGPSGTTDTIQDRNTGGAEQVN
jgi:Peptidase M10 serralysin C terminal